jgi:hypothetical protein
MAARQSEISVAELSRDLRPDVRRLVRKAFALSMD